MAVIRPSADLRNNYSEISKICHETKQPIYITKNGYNDLVLLSNEAYEELTNGWLTEKEIEKRISEKFDKQYADFEEFKKDVLEQINKAINEDIPVYMEGADKSFELPEFKSLDIAKNFVNILDTDKTKEMIDVLNNKDSEDEINVYIGDESIDKALKDFSIITFKRKNQGKDLGTIAIIGPTRMDYSKVISAMRYISKKLDEDKQIDNKTKRKMLNEGEGEKHGK